MPVYTSNSNATLKDALTILRDAKNRFPVMHLSPFDKIVDGDGYVMAKQIDGTYSFKPNITRQGLLFRGDSMFSNSPQTISEHGFDFTQQERFKRLIESFPLYEMFKKGVELPDGRIVKFENPYALAYAYGVPSLFVGLSADLDVASFFAVTQWNNERQKFEPVIQGEGIVCSYELRQPLNQMRSLTTLSLQIFRRTFRQKAYVMQMPENANFNMMHAVTGFKFTHNKDVTEEIFENFKGGETLAPTDDFLWKKWEEVRNNSAEIPVFQKDELRSIYGTVCEYWKEFVELVNFAEGDIEAKSFLLKLPEIEPYARYFDLNRYFDER